MRAACRRMARGDTLAARKIEAEQHFTEPPPRYSRSLAHQEDGGARHRPALDLHLHPHRAARPRLCARSTRSGSSPRTRAASSPPSSRASSGAMSNTISPPISRSSSTASRTARSTGSRCCAISGATSSPRSSDIKDLRVTNVLDALNDILGAAYLPGAGRRRRRARLPVLRQRPAVAEARQVRRLHRLLELSRLPLHPPARRRRGDDGAGGAAPKACSSASIPRPARR